MASFVPHERTLRKILIGTFLPAFPIIIASGCVIIKSRNEWNYYPTSEVVVIFFGLIPIFFSAITSILALQAKHDPLRKRPLWSAGLWFLIDALLVAANLAVLIPVWIYEPNSITHGDFVMLLAYATVFLLSNMFIHLYLALYYPVKAFIETLTKGLDLSFGRTECPHCHGNIRAVETVGGKREGPSFPRGENYLDEPEEGEASTGVIRLPTDSEA